MGELRTESGLRLAIGHARCFWSRMAKLARCDRLRSKHTEQRATVRAADSRPEATAPRRARSGPVSGFASRRRATSACAGAVGADSGD